MKEISANYVPDPAARAATAPAPAHKNRFSVSRTAGSMPVYRPEALTASYAADQDTQNPKTTLGPEAPSFRDLVDVINPLQHIPVVSTIYRKVTGDEISSVARVIGGTVFGGPVGGALALADVAIKEQTGTTVGEKAYNLVRSNKESRSGATTSTIALAKRAPEAPRTAGTLPIWQNEASSTRFNAMLADISDKNNHIS
jgi:hypothetical protein